MKEHHRIESIQTPIFAAQDTRRLKVAARLQQIQRVSEAEYARAEQGSITYVQAKENVELVRREHLEEDLRTQNWVEDITTTPLGILTFLYDPTKTNPSHINERLQTLATAKPDIILFDYEDTLGIFIIRIDSNADHSQKHGGFIDI